MSQKESNLTISTVLESNTRYVVSGGEFHVRQDECTRYFHRGRIEQPTLNVAFHLNGLENVTLDFGGATLVLHGKIQPFLLENCRHVTVENVTIKFERPAFTEMTVLERGQDFMRVRMNPSHPCRVEDGSLIPYCADWENTQLNSCMFLQSFDPETKEGLGLPLCIIGKNAKSDLPPSFHPNHLFAEDGGNGTIIFRGPIHPCYRVGATLALGHEKRVYSSTLMICCEDIHLENYRVLNGSGMGILPIHTKDIFLHKVVFRPEEGSPFLITNQADAVHSFSCSGKFEIIDSVFEGMMDDALNIHGQFYLFEKASGGNRMVLRSKLAGENAYCPIFAAGDTIGIHKGITTEVIQKYTIMELTVLNEDYVEIVVDRDVEGGLEAGYIVENLTAQADITIRNCVFQHANSHLRFQSAGRIRIENCRISMPLLLTGDAFYWYESSGITDMEIRNTAFVTPRGCMNINPQVLPTAAVPYYHRNVRFVDCTFEAEFPLNASMADGIVFERTRNVLGRTMTLNLTNCGAVDAPGCTLVRKTEKKDTVRMN